MAKFQFRTLLNENILNEDKIGKDTYFHDSDSDKYYKYKKGIGFIEVDNPNKKGEKSKNNNDDSNKSKNKGKSNQEETNVSKNKKSNNDGDVSSPDGGDEHKRLKADDIGKDFSTDVESVMSEIEYLNRKLSDNGKDELTIDVENEIKDKPDRTSDVKDMVDYLSKLYGIRDSLISRCNQGGIEVFNDYDDEARQSQRDFTLNHNVDSKNLEREFDKRKKDAKFARKIKGTDVYIDSFGDLFRDSISKFAGRLRGGSTKVQSSTYTSRDAMRRSDKYGRPMTGDRTDIYKKHGMTELYVYVDCSGSWNKEKVTKALDMLGILNEYSDSKLPVGNDESKANSKRPTLKLRTRYTYNDNLVDEFPYVGGINEGRGRSDFDIMAADIHKEKPKNLIIFTDSDSNSCIDYTKDYGWFSYDRTNVSDGGDLIPIPPYETEGFVWLVFADTVADKLVNVVHSTKKEKTMQVRIATSSNHIPEED